MLKNRRNIFYLIILFGAFSGCDFLTTPDKSLPEVTDTKMKLLWEIPYESAGSGINASPLILGDSLVIMSAGKDIYAVDQSTGIIRWKYRESEFTCSQTEQYSTDGIRIFTTQVEDVRAINISDGKLEWVKPMLDERGGFWSNSTLYINNYLYISGTRSLYCFDPISGDIIWSKNIFKDRGLIGSPKYFNSTIFIGGGYGVDDTNRVLVGIVSKLFSVDSQTGETNWSITAQGNGGLTSIIVDNGYVYGGTHFPYSSASFESIDAFTGMRKWSYYTPNEGWDYNDCIVADDKIIVNTGPYWVSAFNKNTGALLWRKFIIQNADSWKVYFHNGFIYHPQGGNIYVMNPDNGDIVHTLNPEEREISTISIGNNKIFVCGFPTLQCYEIYKP